MKEYIIYKTTNLKNGKIYVGKDEYNNPLYLGSGKLINISIKKYGKENFQKEILERCNKRNHRKSEIYWMNKLDSFSPNGYNILNGSFGGDNYTNHPDKEKYSSRLSASHLGIKNTPEQNKKIGLSKMGDKNPSKRRDVKLKISKSKTGVLVKEKNPMFNSNRTKNKLKLLNVNLKGDRWEYLRNKIKCRNIKTGEEIIFDGVKEVVKFLNISKNKYYSHLKSLEPINDTFICEKL